MADTETQKILSYESKRCPYCFAELALDRRICSGCGRKVGKIDNQGRAREPIDWKAYFFCLLAWGVFGMFVWWGFFRD